MSVIIPTFNRPEQLGAALDSIAAQDPNIDVEVIVVNDGGPSARLALQSERPALRVRLVELAQRRGPSAARNVGVELAQGVYIAFLDDDDLFMPEHLAAGCDELERESSDFVYLGAIVSETRLGGRPRDLGGFHVKAYPYEPRLLLVANYLHTGAVIVRNFQRTSVRFDEALGVCEDWDLWLALVSKLRYRVSFVDRITSVYHQLPEVSGLVSGAQSMSPSAFELARRYITCKWPSHDPLVRAYRQWMVDVEQFRSRLIADGRQMPNLLFDQILQYLHARISSGAFPEHTDIAPLFLGS